MKNIYFAAAALVAFVFSACSDDKDSGGGACYITVSMYDGTPFAGTANCMEGISESITKSDCSEANKQMAGYATVTYKDSCPSGEKFKCKERDEDEGFEFWNFYYGPMYEGEDCESMN